METPSTSILWVLLASVIGSFGAVFLKIASARLRFSVVALATNWALILGVGLYLSSSILFLKGVKQGELSVLYPMVSLSYVWTMIWSWLFFKEPFTRTKFMGLGLILAGVIFLNLGR